MVRPKSLVNSSQMTSEIALFALTLEPNLIKPVLVEVGIHSKDKYVPTGGGWRDAVA